MFKKYVLLLLLIMGSLHVNAQQDTGKLFFEHLTTEDGLAHNYILSIFQDEDGFIWLGSDNGLNRYDGQYIETWSTNSLNALGGNKIRRILQDEGKNLWVLHENGLDKIDHYTSRITHYLYGTHLEKYIRGIELNNDSLLIAYTDNNIIAYNSQTDMFEVKVRLQSDIAFTAYARVGNRYYMGTREDGILIYGADWEMVGHVYPRSISGGVLENGSINIMTVDSEGYLWCFVAGECIQRYEPESGIVQTYKLSSNSVINNEVRAMIELDDNYMLIGTFNGLFKLHKEKLQAAVEGGELGERGALNHYSIYSLYKDRQGIIWVGTYAGGINYSHRYNRRFCYFAAPHFLGRISMAREDTEGNIWLGTEGKGLLCHHPETGKVSQVWLESKKRHFNDNIIKSICIAGDTIMCGNWRGEVFLYSIKKNEFVLHHTYERNNVLYIYRDSQNHWWISIQDYGVVCMGEDVKRFPCSNYIKEVVPGIVAFATQREGLYIYHMKDGRTQIIGPTELGLPKETSVSITSVYCDVKKNIWLTTNKGVFVLDEHFKFKQCFLRPENGYTDKLYFVAEQKPGHFWIVSTHKLYLLDYEENRLFTFDKNNGLPLTDMDAYACIDSHNNFWLPGNNGYVRINNVTFSLNEEPSSVILTEFRINNKIQQPGGEHSVLRYGLSETQTVRLRHNQTNISISYASTNHIYANGNRFYYKMDGIDPDWVDAGNRREVFYSNIAPGKYTLRVKSLNNDGAIGPETRLNVEVLPPLWARWWAFVIYALFLSYVLQRYIGYKQRKQKLEHELHLKQMEKDKTEEFNQELQCFFTQVAHEFRTPLTLILNPLDDMQEKVMHISGVQEDVSLIRRNAKRLLALVNDLMDLRKVDGSERQLELSSFDFNDFIREIYYSFQALARQCHINLYLSLPEEVVRVTFDKNGLEKVFFNLLSNALKFTPEGGNVTIRVSALNDSSQLHVEIADTGIGISDEEMSRLFKPFALSHQDLHGQIQGSGVGLAIVKSIIEKHEGSISVSRMSPSGTCFSICLPWRYDKHYELVSQLPSDVGDKEEQFDKKASPTSLKMGAISDTILLVDDNEEILRYLQAGLSKLFKVLIAHNGYEALALLKAETVSLVVSDVMMPEMDGMELCQRIKESPSYCHIPVVLLTAKAMTMYVEEGFQVGADDYLVKPFKMSTLIARINNLLIGRQKLKEIYGKRFSLKSVGLELEPVNQSFVEQYESIVKKHLSEPELDVEMLCREMGVSRATLYRKMKEIVHLSPAEVIRNIRLECAAEMLRTSGQTATEIAYLTGFGSYNHFSDYFKSIYGVSPKMYREKYKNT